MDSFGEYLRKERESRSVSLEEISAATRIRKVFLEAIEGDDTDKLPAEVFLKGFLKAYASYVGLDKDEVVLQYKRYLDGLKNVEEITPPPKKPLFSRRLLIAFPLAIILIVFLFFYFYLGKREEIKTRTDVISKPSAAPSMPTGETTVYPPPLPEETAGSVVTGDKPPKEPGSAVSLADRTEPLRPEEKKAESQKEGEKNLLVKTSETTWLRVQIDDKPPFEVLLKPGENLTWNALRTLKLSIGNAGGIDLFYNGKALGKLGNSGQVASITLPNEKFR
ncbi:MAG: helix-turn-helix domain-containing protein [Desulfobacterales bacterium]|nr:helix-turn-helix domain-containing protein [Desulfobacterales bacterium]